MRKNFSKLENRPDGYYSIWVKACFIPQCVRTDYLANMAELVMEDKGYWIEAKDTKKRDFEICFKSKTVSELLETKDSYVCVILDIDESGRDQNVKLLLRKIESASKKQLVDFYATLVDTMQNVTFVKNETYKRLKGYDPTILNLKLYNVTSDIIFIYDASTSDIIGSMQCKELLKLIKTEGPQVGVFKNIDGKLNIKKIKVIISVLRDVAKEKSKAVDIRSVDDYSVDDEEYIDESDSHSDSNSDYTKVDIDNLDILQSDPIDLETTSALVYIKFVDPNGNSQRVSIMNGNMQINVVGSSYIDDYGEYEEQIKVGDTVRLVPEPTNPVDPDAIAVKWNGKHIGYVPKSRIPAVALCMDGSAGCKGVVYENNCGWVAFELKPTLQNLHNKGCVAKYGPFQFDVISNNECVTLDTAQFLQYFKIGKTKKSSLKSIATTKYTAKRLKTLLKSDSKYLATFDFDSLPYSARNSSKIHKYLNLNDHELISENMEFLNCINPDSKALDYLLCKKSLPEALFFFESIRFFMSQSELKKDQLKKDKSSTPIEINTVDELLDYVKTYSEMTSDMLNVMPMIINNKFPEYLGAPGVMSNLKGLYALAVSIDQIYLDMLNLIAEIKTIKAPAAYKEVLDYIGKNTTSLIKQFEHFMKDCLDQLVYYVDHEPDPNGVEINLHYSFELDESFADRVFQMIDRLK